MSGKRTKILFVDDRAERISWALENYKDYELTISPNVLDALRQMNINNFDLISLDFDLNGEDFQEIDDKTSGMAIVRYIGTTGWPPFKKKPEFIIHSTNNFAANLMVAELSEMGFDAHHSPPWKLYKRGVIAGAFDVIHPGYALMFREIYKRCYSITVFLHDKPNQIFSLDDRITNLLAIKGVDECHIYRTEEDLQRLLETVDYDVRFNGEDHKKDVNLSEVVFGIPTIYIERKHKYSATWFKSKIKKEYKGDKS